MTQISSPVQPKVIFAMFIGGGLERNDCWESLVSRIGTSLLNSQTKTESTIFTFESGSHGIERATQQ